MKYWVLYWPTQHPGENLQGIAKHQISGEQQPEDLTTWLNWKQPQNKSRKNTHTIKRQNNMNAGIARINERQNLSAQIYTPANYTYTSAHAQTNIRYRGEHIFLLITKTNVGEYLWCLVRWSSRSFPIKKRWFEMISSFFKFSLLCPCWKTCLASKFIAELLGWKIHVTEYLLSWH